MGDKSDGVQNTLPPALVRSLTDKLYEKRKAAAQEIEKLMRELIAGNQTTQVARTLDTLSDLARSPNPHSRKGGLIGLAAAAIALGQGAAKHSDALIPPVVECFNDNDARVRYYACESLYNIVKVARSGALRHFSDLFDTLARLAADVDQNVRGGAELLDRMLKDIVAASLDDFDIAQLMVLIRERIYNKDSAVRSFLVSWLSSMYAVPSVDLLPYLPEILDGLFQTMCDPKQPVRELCEAVLAQFLGGVRATPAEVDMPHMVNVLIVHAQAGQHNVPGVGATPAAALQPAIDETAAAAARYMALVWLREFLVIGGDKLLPYTSGYLVAILPCLSSTDAKSLRDLHEVAKGVNIQLMRLINETSPEKRRELSFELAPVIDVLQDHMGHASVQTRLAVLKWLHHLHARMPTEMFAFMHRIFPKLLELMSDPSDEVILLDLEVIAAVCDDARLSSTQSASLQHADAQPSGQGGDSREVLMADLHLTESVRAQLAPDAGPFFLRFVLSLLGMFRRDVSLLHERGTFILRQLCLLMKADRVFCTIAIILLDESDCWFAAQLVQTLNGILLTATELFPLRVRLHDVLQGAKEKEKDKDGSSMGEDSRHLFLTLYKCWCHQPVAAVALCLLGQCYEQAANLIGHFVELDVTVDFLTEIDKFIQLLESPVFAYLRLHLLDRSRRPALSTVLYGLLMLLPQTEAFHTLHRRLQSVPAIGADSSDRSRSLPKDKEKNRSSIEWDELREHFVAVQRRHAQFRRLRHRELLAKSA